MHKPLMGLIRRLSGEVDIFCFQEVFSTTADIEISDGAKANLHEDISAILKSYRAFHSPKSKGYDTSPVKFADYVLVTPGVAVEAFAVLPDEVSDHLALRMDFA